jgi:hypothetical protein
MCTQSDPADEYAIALYMCARIYTSREKFTAFAVIFTAEHVLFTEILP